MWRTVVNDCEFPCLNAHTQPGFRQLLYSNAQGWPWLLTSCLALCSSLPLLPLSSPHSYFPDIVKLGMVAPIYNSSTLGGWGKRIPSLTPTWAT